MRFRALDVARATSGNLHGPDVALDGVSFDSRSVRVGQLFVPIVAERDGHDFIDVALAAGAGAYLTSDAPRAGTAIEVDDTLAALMRLGAALRDRVSATVVGITGSVGKTSTKDMLAAALAPSRRVHANERSFNNEQGLPTTIANAPDDIDVMVLEMGMRGFGEIAGLCEIARPDIGIITRVAEAHSDRLGGIEGVAQAKAELVRALPPGGTAVLNADDPRVLAMAGFTPARAVTVGESPVADVRIADVRLDDAARPSFVLAGPWGSTPVRLSIAGRHMVINAALALATVHTVGGDVDAGAAALADVGLTPMRMQVRRTAGGATVVDDSYNANPTSMRAALDALADLPATRRIAVLGLMAEISNPEAEHRDIVTYARARGIEVIAVHTDLYGVAPVDDPLPLLGSLAGGDAVLVKGSRVVGLERVAIALFQA